jgi:hypothetical protein
MNLDIRVCLTLQPCVFVDARDITSSSTFSHCLPPSVIHPGIQNRSVFVHKNLDSILGHVICFLIKEMLVYTTINTQISGKISIDFQLKFCRKEEKLFDGMSK